jgi:hypothetical protein
MLVLSDSGQAGAIEKFGSEITPEMAQAGWDAYAWFHSEAFSEWYGN